MIIDRDLAEIYGVKTRRLNEQVKRNKERFPEDFIFQLTREETEMWIRSRSQIATLKRGQNGGPGGELLCMHIKNTGREK